jgi:hypothetical protein
MCNAVYSSYSFSCLLLNIHSYSHLKAFPAYLEHHDATLRLALRRGIRSSSSSEMHVLQPGHDLCRDG